MGWTVFARKPTRDRKHTRGSLTSALSQIINTEHLENSKSAAPSEVAKGVIITWLIVEVLRVKKDGI
jgi:hypothetical protein